MLKIDALVIGCSLRSLQFADETGATILINGSEIPHKIENFKEWEEWYRLTFVLGMRGLTPLSSGVEKIRIEDTVAKIITESSKVIKIQFKKLYVFGMERVEGIPVKERVNKYIVYDWFNIKRGAKQVVEKILSPGDFVTKLCFYPSERKDGNDGSFKDCYTKSYISSENIEKFEYSETASKFAAMKLIKEKDLKGPSRQFGERTHHLNLILEHSTRDLHKYEKEFIISEKLPANIFLL